MADEQTVPLLPCASVDEVADFYRVLGFRSTYRQLRPNPYVALQREDLHLHFFGMPGFDPEQSYGSCLVVVPDVTALHRAFAAGMRAEYGKVLVSGIPRMTRPRPKKNMDGTTGFSVVDPGGNWIRIVARPSDPPPESESESKSETATGTPRTAPDRLVTALENAVVQGDSRGDHSQGARILDTALNRSSASDDPVALVEALVYRAELALTLNDPATAERMLTRVDAIELSPADREQLANTLESAADLAANLAAGGTDAQPPT